MPERILIPRHFDFASTLGKFFPQPQAGEAIAAAPEQMEAINE